MELKVNVLLLHQGSETVQTAMDELYHIAQRYFQLEIAGLGLAELQNLLQQANQTTDIVVHHSILVTIGGGQLLQFVYRS